MRWWILAMVACEGGAGTTKPTADTGAQLATTDTAPPPPLCPWEGSYTALVECGSYGPTVFTDTSMAIASLDGAPDECELRLSLTEPDEGIDLVEVLTLDADTMEARAVVVERDGVPDDPPYTRSLGRLTIEESGAGYVLTFESHLWASGCGVPPIVTITP